MNKIVVVDPKGEKKSRSLWDMFVNFLAMGGFLVILILGVIILIAISYLTK